jgi:hypothetical protein
MSASEVGKRSSKHTLEGAHLGVMNEAKVTSRVGHGSSECALRGTNLHRVSEATVSFGSGE